MQFSSESMLQLHTAHSINWLPHLNGACQCTQAWLPLEDGIHVDHVERGCTEQSNQGDSPLPSTAHLNSTSYKHCIRRAPYTMKPYTIL